MPTLKRRNNTDHGKRSVAATKNGVPEKALPVTLLSGFLGSGKTTLLQHILRSDHGLRIAVVVNDIGAINIDANLIRSTHTLSQTKEKVVALQNGCICCTLRGDLLEELVRLASLAEFDYIVIESSGISEPEQVAETFDARLADQIAAIGADDGEGGGLSGLDADMLATLKRLKDVGGLEKFAKLDTTVTVIDAFTLYNDFETAELLSSRRDDVVPEDERTVSDLMVDQIEFADVILINKIDLVEEETRERIRQLVRDLNHRAKVIETVRGKVDVRQILDTGLFSLEKAQTGYGWLQDLHAMTVREVNGRKKVTPKPETEEYNVRNFVYSRRRPFHPLRLFQLIHDKFILQQPFEDEDGEEDEDEEMGEVDSDSEQKDDDTDLTMQDDPLPSSNAAPRSSSQKSISSSSSNEPSSSADRASSATSVSMGDSSSPKDVDKDEDETDFPTIPETATILANKRSHPLFSRLFRSKGDFWLATRDMAGDWSQAGSMLTLTGAHAWFCNLERCEWEVGNKEIDELVEWDMKKGGEWGDRRQELVFIGEIDHKAIEKVLDACLLSDEEWEQWQQIMRQAKELGKEEREAFLEEALAQVFDDGFPEWPQEDEDHEGHDHDHGHGDVVHEVS